MMSEARPSDEAVRRDRPPRAVRVVAWFTTFLGAWGLVEEVVRGSGRLSTNWLNLAIGLAYLIAGIGLIRGRLWAYIPTVALWASSLVWAGWYFFIEGAEREAAGPVGFGVIALTSVPFAFLLSRGATTWARKARKAPRAKGSPPGVE